jgi:DNA-binding response OmpR family regulator
MFNILIVEDDKNTRKLMEDTIKEQGYNTFTAENGEKALSLMEAKQIDLAVVDVMMPVMDGLQFADILRKSGVNIPLLIVSAKGETNDIKKGFLVGTDDYMVKPVDEEEMLLRIKALLRRSKIVNEHKLQIGCVVLDYDTFTVTRKEQVHCLPKKEFMLLFKLLSYPDVIFTRVQLMDEIWGMDSNSDENTVAVHINKLRSRFKDYPEFEIATSRGLGYKAVKKDETK